jgi:ribose 5-phosphate isomerase B
MSLANKITKLFLIADHAGYDYKNKIKDQIVKINSLKVVDLCVNFDKNDDYPLVVGQSIKQIVGSPEYLILGFCGSGNGVCIALNRYKQIRAVNAISLNQVEMSRKHNDANALCFEGNYNQKITLARVKKDLQIIERFVSTEFENLPRHIRRIKQLS